jgi:hypothetical protein
VVVENDYWDALSKTGGKLANAIIVPAEASADRAHVLGPDGRHLCRIAQNPRVSSSDASNARPFGGENMTLKTLILSVLCLATVTACATPLENAMTARAAARQQAASSTAKVTDGAGDPIGKLTSLDRVFNPNTVMEASAAQSK